MIRASGHTFNHRDLFRSWRGRWSPHDQCWKFDNLSTAQIAELKKLVGVSVSEQEDEPDNGDTSDIVRAILANNDRNTSVRDGPTAIYGDDPTYLNKFKHKNPTAFFGFSSLPAFVDYVARLRRPASDTRATGWDVSETDGWAGTRNMAAALDLARNGWHDGLAAADGLEIPHATARKRLHGLAGGSVNVGRMLAGNPSHMRRRAKRDGQRIVTLFVESSASGIIPADRMTERAILIGRIADVLEREGYSCEIVAIQTTLNDRGSTVGHQCAVTLKRAGERLNLLDVIFGLGHPSFLRRFIFACVGAADECRSTHSSQGKPNVAFDADWPCGPREFYVEKLTYGDKRPMIEQIEPVGLPITIRNV